MWNIFYRNFRLLILTICLILVWGLTSFETLPRMEDPEISDRWALITTQFPGASAARVESLVTDKIEQKLTEIEEIKTIMSSSYIGSSSIVLKLKPQISDIEGAWSKIRDKLGDVIPQLPDKALKPEFKVISSRVYSLIAALTWELDTPANYAILSRLAEELENKLLGVGGTETVELAGSLQEEIVVEIEPAALQSLGITPQELAGQIRLSDAKVSAGQVRGESNDILVEVDTELDSIEQIRSIPISVAKNSGEVARLGDIAQVKKGIREPATELAIINGRAAIAVAAQAESDSRIDYWTKTMRQTIKEFKENLPEGVGLDIIFYQNIYVTEQIKSLMQNFWFGSLLVLICTCLIMGWKSTWVIGTSLPLTVLMVFGAMKMLGISVNNISVTGLIIALGMLIDNAIIMVDELTCELKTTIHPEQAITQRVSYLANPLLSSTLTTVLSFLPMILMSGESGEFVSGLGYTVILALLSSLFVTLTIIPALTARMHKIEDEIRHQKKSAKYWISYWWQHGFSHPRLTSSYRYILDRMFRKPLLGVVLSLIIPVIGFVVSPNLPLQLFPPTERNQVYIELQLPGSASMKETHSQVLEVEKIIGQHPEIVNVQWFLGRNAPAFYYNVERLRTNQANYAQGIVKFKSLGRNTNELINTMQKELDLTFPSTIVLLRQLEQGAWAPAPIELRIYGHNLDTLRDLGNQARLAMSEVKEITHTNASISDVLPKLELRLDEEQARIAGLDNTEIAQQLDASLEGYVGGSILEDTEELPVRVRLSQANRSNLEDVASLDIIGRNENKSSIPLSAIAELKLASEVANITRRNNERVNNIYGYIQAGVLPETVLTALKQRLEEINFQLPPGYSLEYGGNFEIRNDTFNNLFDTIPVIVVLTLACLVLSLGSFLSTGIVVLVGIASMGFGLLSLWIFHYPLGFMAILGIVALVGVSINDSIVVLTAFGADPNARRGNIKVIREIVIHCTRHNLATTITSVASFTPLLLSGGLFWPPMAVSMVVGIIGTTFMAISFTPCIYLLLIKRTRSF
ncbi:MAG: efflux RND transporter permease subunit [Gomphosphaeria aponina SAG 52.96 = DSM 107014]|uniref:Efflux RND transporter permease subunit n=1 Tax=Gomphosphaeria aponina SAG 52.96 = DSM 107014 TaxID=1521640 RepID=A0A941GXL8_9CHRO|nr:efflux RND transporter permease subunit [Gomphosphaeria aponina SAG 52.96 = DSM 107014]